jgi:hypothetical protein
MILTPPLGHQWPQLSVHDDVDKLPQTSWSPELETTHHGYLDTAAMMQDHSKLDWQQQLWWWTIFMEPPSQATQDDDFLHTMTELAHPNYANFYREIPSGYSRQIQPTVSHPQASKPEGFDLDSELVAAEQYYEQTMHHGFFDAAPVAATSGDHRVHNSEILQASGSLQRLGAGHEINSRLYTTCFDPPPQSYRYMPYPSPARSFQPCTSSIPADQGDMGVGSFFSPMPTMSLPTMITLPPLVTVVPQAAPPAPAPTIPPTPTIPPAPPHQHLPYFLQH